MEKFIKIEYLHTNKFIYSINKELSLEEYNSFLNTNEPEKYNTNGYCFIKEREFIEEEIIPSQDEY